MRVPASRIAPLALLVFTAACHLGWKPRADAQVLAEIRPPPPSSNSDPETAAVERPCYAPALGVSFVLPEGWHWVLRGDDLVATRDGVFLQNILVERIRIDSIEQEVAGFFTVAALSSKQWPVRTAKHLQARFRAGMSPADAARALLDSRAHDPSLLDLASSEVLATSVAGKPAFRVACEFRLNPLGNPDPEWVLYAWPKFSVQGRATPYRSITCGFVLGDWVYGFSYSGARRYYFDRDLAAFERFLGSVELIEAARAERTP